MSSIKRFRIVLVIVSLLLTSLLSHCSPAAAPAQTPEQVVESFYRWYLGYPGNPMVDRAYRTSEALADSLVNEIDALLASPQGGHFDPFLLAQDIPVKFIAREALISGDAATVVVEQWWGGNDTPREIEVALALMDGAWKITKITDPALDQVEDQLGMEAGAQPSAPAQEVVERFYAWYLEYIGERGSDQMRNPLSDGAYRDSEFLTPALVQQVDELLASFDKGGYDPFLCAQDIPDRILVSQLETEGDRAQALMSSSFQGHQWQVLLTQTDGAWQIAEVVCSEPEASEPVSLAPEEVVEHFYNWYIAYIGERGSDQMRNPLSDGAYRDSEFLTPALIAAVDAIPAEHGYFPYDPFLCAQDIPQEFVFSKAAIEGERATVMVCTSFAGHSLNLELVAVDGAWRIDAITCQADLSEPAPSAGAEIPAGWQTFQDDQYGFQLAFPADWTAQEVELRYPELDAPLVRIIHLLPLDLAEGMQTDGPPDPTQPAVVAPLGVEVMEGTLDEYHSRYLEPAASQQIEINGMLVIKETDAAGDLALIRYIFQHPARPEIRVMLVDQISGFSDRARENPEAMAIIDQIITTFSFTG